jgi:hypothetical protein
VSSHLTLTEIDRRLAYYAQQKADMSPDDKQRLWETINQLLDLRLERAVPSKGREE